MGKDEGQVSRPLDRESKRIGIVYFDGGTAHRTVSFALRDALVRAHPHWDVRTIDALDIFTYHPLFHAKLRCGLNWYNRSLQRGRVRGLASCLPLAVVSHDLMMPGVVRKICRFWRDSAPDVLISTIPLYNEVLHRSILLERPNAVCMTIPVDFEEPTRRYWFSTRIEQHFICGTDRLVEQARAAGAPDEHVHRISGMIVHPYFYDGNPEMIAQGFDKLGLSPDLPVGLVSFGGQGSDIMIDIARLLEESGIDLGMIFICGRNARAYEALGRQKTRYRKAVLGFTENMHRYLSLADFFIGKPGPVSIHEAVVCKTPLILVHSRGMSILLDPNERWVSEQRVGIVIREVGELVPAISEVLRSDTYVESAARLHIRGVFEAVEIIESILTTSPLPVECRDELSLSKTPSGCQQEVQEDEFHG